MENIELIEAAKKGNKKAFEIIVQKYHDELFYTAIGIVRSGWDALDICQDTFLKAYTSIKSLNDASKFRSWLNRILINKCNDYFRKNKKVIVMENVEYEEFFVEGTDENIDLLKALSGLKREFRMVLTLRYFQDLPLKEIAVILECPEGTVKSRISYGINELRKVLKQDYEGRYKNGLQ